MTTFPGDSSGSLAAPATLNPITKLILLVSACVVALRIEDPLHALAFFGFVIFGHVLAQVKPLSCGGEHGAYSSSASSSLPARSCWSRVSPGKCESPMEP